MFYRYDCSIRSVSLLSESLLVCATEMPLESLCKNQDMFDAPSKSTHSQTMVDNHVQSAFKNLLLFIKYNFIQEVVHFVLLMENVYSLCNYYSNYKKIINSRGILTNEYIDKGLPILKDIPEYLMNSWFWKPSNSEIYVTDLLDFSCSILPFQLCSMETISQRTMNLTSSSCQRNKPHLNPSPEPCSTFPEIHRYCR